MNLKNEGFPRGSPVENVRHVGEVAKLMTYAGLVVSCAFISPFRAARQMERELLGEELIEVFADTPIEECIDRDPDGLYKRALAGRIEKFIGFDQTCEMSEIPDLQFMTGRDEARLRFR